MPLSDNLVYIVDSSQKIIYFNENAKKAFPSIEVGKTCNEATGNIDSPCSQCPLNSGRSESFSRFNINLSRWINMSFAPMEYPGHGNCTVVTGTLYNSLDKEIMSHVKFLDDFDFAMEMNLTMDRYVMLSHQNFGEKVMLEEEPLSVLLKRTADTMVHPADIQKFNDFFDLSSLSSRLQKAKMPIREIIREKNTCGTFDDVSITLLPESQLQNGHELVVALFHIEKKKKVVKTENLERDDLTGLLKKNPFTNVASDFMKAFHDKVCVIYIDIEHFRLFNKWYSRWQGDRLLKSIGLFLLQMDRLFGTVSGYGGGDDFFIICDKQSSVLDYLVSGLNELIKCFDGIEGFRIAYGGYELKDKTEDIQDVLDLASTACNLDISQSANKICWYKDSMIQQEEKEQLLIPDFERGLEEGEFTFYLQPKCSIQQNKIIGAEALVRWIHKIKGFVSPAEFIPALENRGLVARLDVYIWEQVCKKISEWKKQGLDPVPVSVNVSRIDIFNLDVPAKFTEFIEKYQIDPELIEIEITESAFVDDSKIMKSVILRLRELGFKILIDDFGSGYSSLNMLKDVQADVLKMDVKFFDLNSVNFEKGLNIITGVVEMSHSIGLPVIAEGVETQEQINILQNIGLNYVQGYYYYKPLKISDYEDLLLQKNKISHKRMGIA